MAAKKKAHKRPKKSAAQKAAEVKRAAAKCDISVTALKKIDESCVKNGKRPLSFLANMLDKTEEHLPKLRAEVAKLAKKAK